MTFCLCLFVWLGVSLWQGVFKTQKRHNIFRPFRHFFPIKIQGCPGNKCAPKSFASFLPISCVPILKPVCHQSQNFSGLCLKPRPWKSKTRPMALNTNNEKSHLFTFQQRVTENKPCQRKSFSCLEIFFCQRGFPFIFVSEIEAFSFSEEYIYTNKGPEKKAKLTCNFWLFW